MLMNSGEYLATIEQVKREINSAQYRMALHVNADLILLYHSIGCVINEHKEWGNKFIDNLAADLRIEFPNSRGYSVRNLKYMAKFAQTYPDREFVQQAVAQIPWGHNIVLLDKLSNPDASRSASGKRTSCRASLPLRWGSRLHSPPRKSRRFSTR